VYQKILALGAAEDAAAAANETEDMDTDTALPA